MYVVFDFETFYDAKAKYSLKHMTVQQYIRDPRFKVLGMSYAIDGGEAKWIEGDDIIQEFFDNLTRIPDVCLIAHNATFDSAVARRVYGYEAPRYVCTMFLARYLIAQGVLPYDIDTSLATIAKFASAGDKGHLDEALADGSLSDYAIQDTEICRAFWERFKAAVPAEELDYIDMHVKASSLPNLELDEAALKEVAEVDEERKKWYTTVRNDKALESMLTARGVEIEYKEMKKGKAPCFAKSDDFMQGLLLHDDPVVRYLAELRLEAKSTCAVSKAQRFLDCGSPMSCPLVYYACHTGRSGGTDAMNVQNMPRGSALRTSLMAQEGRKLIIIDSSQIEVRTLGMLAKDESILSVFRRGGDIYREFAGHHLYNKEPGEATKEERQIAKAAVLALGFGQGAQGFIAYAKRMGINLTEEQAQHAVTTYRKAFPMITGGLRFGGYWQEAKEFALANGYSLLPNGRKIMYPNLRWEGNELVFNRHRIFSKSKRAENTKLWHGLIAENCLIFNALVITLDGPKPMCDVKPNDFVYDGEQFVPCGGYVSKGKQKVITKWGLTMTPDHKVLCKDGYKEFRYARKKDARIICERQYNLVSYKNGPSDYEEVGDLLNCGPNHRFAVVSEDGYIYIVHNCTQAAARDIIFSQTAKVLKKYAEARLCLMVHDEAIFSVPAEIAQEVYEYADECFKTPPEWAGNMPVQGEGHISDRYDK